MGFLTYASSDNSIDWDFKTFSILNPCPRFLPSEAPLYEISLILNHNKFEFLLFLGHLVGVKENKCRD